MALGRTGLIRRRTTWLFIVFALAYCSIAARLFVVQCHNAKRYEEWARIIRCRKLVLPASRGRILDRTGRPLAFSIQTASIYANRNEAGSRLSDVASRVALLLGRDEQSILGKLSGTASIIWLYRHIDPRLCERVRLRGADLPGVGIAEDTKRVYPSGSMAAQVLGFANVDGFGVEGLEHTLNRSLEGRNGVCRGELDAHRRIIPETRCVQREPENGKDVRLTIDMTIQHVAEVALNTMASQYHPTSACAIVMNPQTGEILAVANYPTCGPTTPKAPPKDESHSPWRNRAVADLYEPGSTLKVVTVSAALNEGISPTEVVAHCTGSEKVANGRIRCTLHGAFHAGHGAVDMSRLIEQSCNIGAAHLARRMGAVKLYGYEKAFGLLSRPRAGFGCEAAYMGMPKPEDWRVMKLCNVGFGQGIAVTALQMAGVYQTVANGGVRVQPRVIREVRNPDGSLYKRFRIGEKQRVVSASAARTMTDLLVKCVVNGTGKNAKIAGRTVAGKTGSAQIALPKGGYESSAFVASFMGFVPARNPRLVIAVVVHRPQGCHWGATVAAPVFREIGEKGLWYLRVPADEPAAPKHKEADHKHAV